MMASTQPWRQQPSDVDSDVVVAPLKGSLSETQSARPMRRFWQLEDSADAYFFWPSSVMASTVCVCVCVFAVMCMCVCLRVVGGGEPGGRRIARRRPTSQAARVVPRCHSRLGSKTEGSQSVAFFTGHSVGGGDQGG